MKYCTGRFLDRGGEAVDEGSIQVNSLPSSVHKKTQDKGLPDSTVLASEANRYPCTIVPVQCEHASTVQKNTGMRALPEIQCDTESPQGSCGAVNYLLCITLTPVRRTILLPR